MKFGKIIGKVICTQKVESYEGVKLLVVQPLTENLEEKGKPYIAADPVTRSGKGDIVFVVFSRDATMAFEDPFIPVDASIVGLVDKVDI